MPKLTIMAFSYGLSTDQPTIVLNRSLNIHVFLGQVANYRVALLQKQKHESRYAYIKYFFLLYHSFLLDCWRYLVLDKFVIDENKRR